MQTEAKKKILRGLTILCVLAFTIATAYLGKYYYNMNADQHTFSKLTAINSEIEDESAYSYDVFKEANSDYAGWLTIEGTNIDYPVMYTPNDPEYYLRRSFEKKYSKSGVPFIDGACTLDSNNLAIHGHNMKNGTMFSELLRYEDKYFAKIYPYITFADKDGENVYQIIAAFYTQIYTEDDIAFKYYDYFGELDSEQMARYLNNIEQIALYYDDVAVTAEDKLLTLSTCAYQIEDGRFVVVAKKIDKSV